MIWCSRVPPPAVAIPSLSGSNRTLAPYIIGFDENKREVSAAEGGQPEALELVEALQRSGEEIKFIRAPAEGEIGVEMLRVLANEEGLD